MMTPNMHVRTLYSSLKERGLFVGFNKSGLFGVGPGNELTDEDKQVIAQYRDELVALCRPTIELDGSLRIPMTAEQRYRWWQDGGQTLMETLIELDAPVKTWQGLIARAPKNDLVTNGHPFRCSGQVCRQGDVLYCLSCQYWQDALKLIIAGGRDRHLTPENIAVLDYLKPWIYDVVSGYGGKTDMDGVEWAQSNGYKPVPFPADWADLSWPDAVIKTRPDGTRYDAKAGIRRNAIMATYANALIAFPGGNGTNDMCRQAANSELIIFDYRT